MVSKGRPLQAELSRVRDFLMTGAVVSRVQHLIDAAIVREDFRITALLELNDIDVSDISDDVGNVFIDPDSLFDDEAMEESSPAPVDCTEALQEGEGAFETENANGSRRCRGCRCSGS